MDRTAVPRARRAGPSRRVLIAGSAAAALSTVAGVPAGAQRRLVLNDASRLSATPVFSHWIARGDDEAAFIARLRTELRTAREAGRPVAVSAARHSMGGQSLPRDGHAMTFDRVRVEADRAARRYRVSGGARWHEVIGSIDRQGFSPAVMQSNSDFSVAATFSVNAHGWPCPYGPFGSTVESLRLMLANGEIVSCSRTENAELFRLAMGGYGLIGIILDLDCAMVPNAMMRPRFEIMPAEAFADRFTGAFRTDPAVTMIYGRLNVAREALFQEALLVTWRADPTPPGGLPPADRGGGILSEMARRIYRAQVGQEWAKGLRWWAEGSLNPMITAGTGTRNSLMNEPVVNLLNEEPNRTDILHEYFVAPERFGDFLAACRRIIPRARAEFLNVTLRYVARDPDSVLAYATTDRIAAVMSFSQAMTDEGEADMYALTEDLIDAVGAIGGSYYLPYRLHARRDQLSRLYPEAGRFAERKRQLDPGLVFRNALWDTYFAR